MCSTHSMRKPESPRTAEELLQEAKRKKGSGMAVSSIEVAKKALAELKRKQEYAATQGMDLDEVEKEERDNILRDSIR